MNKNSDQLTVAEEVVLNLLSEAWGEFQGLPVEHPEDRHEFMHAIHQAQRIVAARPAFRVLNGPAYEAFDPIKTFVAERCDLVEGEAEAAGTLYGAYCRWWVDKGYKHPVSPKRFNLSMQRIPGLARKQAGLGGIWEYVGVRLKDEGEG